MHLGRFGPAASDGQAPWREILDSALGSSERGLRVSWVIGGTPRLSDGAAGPDSGQVQADG